MNNDFVIFSGTANPMLSAEVARLLGRRLGRSAVERFPDGELTVTLVDAVRRKDVFIVQATAPPVNEHLVELLAFADACRRASAAHISAIIPYFGYARADKRHGRREPITGSMAADVIQAVGVNQVMTVDLHAPQIEGFFHIPVDGLTAVGLLSDAIKSQIPPDTVVVSPDAGRVRMATLYAQRLNTELAVLHKMRESGSRTHVTHLVGEVRDRACVIIDDMISTGGTIAESICTLIAAGARSEIYVAATHGVLLTGAKERLSQAQVRRVFVTDTIEQADRSWSPLQIVSIAPLIAGAIQRIMANGSMSDLA